MKYLIILLASLLFLSCSDEQITSPVFPIDEATIGVKSKTFYPTLESTQILSIEDFEYNNGQLQKRIYYSGNREVVSHYELFSYDNNGKLLNKLNYHSNINSPTGFILLGSTNYIYSENLLTTEKLLAPYADSYTQYDYKYEGKYLTRKSKYYNGALDSYIVYKYIRGKLSKEINYHKDNSIIEAKEYKYMGAAITEVVYYTSQNHVMRKINYSYNDKGKLVLEVVNELLSYSSSLPYVIRYTY